MTDRPFRKPMRYRGHDYRAPCSVHLTICTWHRQHLFGTVDQTGATLNDAGRFVEATLRRLHDPEAGIELDTHIVMPDHLHVILHLGTNPIIETTVSVPQLVHAYKVRVTRSWPGGVRQHGWPRYIEHLWQKSYYDTLVRTDRHLAAIRAYILDNPRRWVERHDALR